MNVGLIISIVSIVLAVGGVSVASLYSSRKQALLHHIDGMLKNLRNIETWDDRSESKLFQWMLESDESTIHYRSLLELRNILNNLISYWAVHVSMDSDEDLTPEEIVYDFNKEPETWSVRFIFKELFFPDKPRLLI